MNKIPFLLALALSVIALSCTKEPEELNLDPETELLVSIVQDELEPLDKDPFAWKDQDLRWLDPLASKSVIGLGEATHGTAEFFDAKHRIFKYMVENHGFRIFAIEADFGESLFIDEAVQAGNAAAIEDLLKEKMHFWTWKTEEVRDMLEWMCSYNQGKAENEKVHYMGVDCQFNTYHPEIARDYLKLTPVPFHAFADSVLSEVEIAQVQNYESFDGPSFEVYRQRLFALQDSITKYRELMIGSTSEKDYQLHERIVEVIRQVSEVRFYMQEQLSSGMDTRDRYMAENTAWLLDYFENDRVVVWAHNYHVSNFESGVVSTMGNYLNYRLGNQYAIIGFLFSQGTFTAAEMEGDEAIGFGVQTLDTPPKENSLNALMSYAGEPAFSVEIDALRSYLGWYNAFEAGMDYFFMGSGYNNHPEDYYVDFDPDYYDHLIYFETSTATELL